MLVQTRVRLIWRSLVSVLLLVCALAVYRGVSNLVQVRAELEQSKQINLRLDQDNRALYNQVTRLRNESQALERVCRREMGMVRADEVVYQLSAPPGAPGQE